MAKDGEQDGERISKQFLRSVWKKRNERPNDGGVSIRSRNGAPSRKGCVVNGQMTNKQQMSTPPSHPSCRKIKNRFGCKLPPLS